MNHPETGDIFYYLLLLILPVMSLVARRMPIAQTAKMVLAWVGIFAALLFVVTFATRSGITPGTIADTLGLSSQSVTGGTVSIAKAPDGHFWATVSINGIERRMLVDSGATVTSITPETARAAGIDAEADKFGTIIDTANGPAVVRRATASKVVLGSISARDLDVLVGSNFGNSEIIGMNFLSRLKSWRVEGDRLVLEARP